jgi:hypothetical protein
MMQVLQCRTYEEWMTQKVGILMSILLSVVTTIEAQGAEEQEESLSASPLLVLLAASDDASIKIERQLVAELRLTLDGVQVEQIAIERGDFLTLTLPEQLDVVQPLIKHFLARAAVWVVVGGQNGHLIQFVVSDRGNSTVRTVDAGSPEELALAVRELLDSAYLFNPKNKKEEPQAPRYHFALGSTFSISGGMVGHEGASVTGGSGVQARFAIGKGGLLGLHIAGKLGPREKESDGMVLGWRTEFGGVLGYLFRIGDFSAGPYGELMALRSTFNAILGSGDYQKQSWWAFRGALGLEMSLKLSGQLSLFVDWTVGGIVKPLRFKRNSDKQPTTVLVTPSVDYLFTIGFATSLL